MLDFGFVLEYFVVDVVGERGCDREGRGAEALEGEYDLLAGGRNIATGFNDPFATVLVGVQFNCV